MKRLSFGSLLIGLALSATALTGCGSGGGYASYTEYRVPPILTPAELRQRELDERRRREQTLPGGANEARGDSPI